MEMIIENFIILAAPAYMLYELHGICRRGSGEHTLAGAHKSEEGVSFLKLEIGEFFTEFLGVDVGNGDEEGEGDS